MNESTPAAAKPAIPSQRSSSIWTSPGAVSVRNGSSGSAEAWISADRISNGATTTNTSVRQRAEVPPVDRDRDVEDLTDAERREDARA